MVVYRRPWLGLPELHPLTKHVFSLIFHYQTVSEQNRNSLEVYFFSNFQAADYFCDAFLDMCELWHEFEKIGVQGTPWWKKFLCRILIAIWLLFHDIKFWVIILQTGKSNPLSLLDFSALEYKCIEMKMPFPSQKLYQPFVYSSLISQFVLIYFLKCCQSYIYQVL